MRAPCFLRQTSVDSTRRASDGIDTSSLPTVSLPTISLALGLTLLAPIAAVAIPAFAQAPAAVEPGPLAPLGFPTPEATSDRLLDLAKLAPGRASIVRIAVARTGPMVGALILGDQDFSKKRPAMLVVAGMDGVNLGSTEQCFAAVERLLRENAGILDAMRLYVIPEMNPDARAHAILRRELRATNSRAVDDDRDGRFDEDGATDLNQDGFVGMVWRVAPPGTKATHVIDPVDARIVRPANREKGEVATIEILREAVDDDSDGRCGEDGPGGVDLDRNFPHRWSEFASDAGPFPLSEPETLGLAKFVRDHPDIVTAVVFGRHDTLVNFPDTKDKDATGRTPVVYLAEDHGLYREFSKLWKESTKIERSTGADLAGSLVLWLANHRGIAAVAANGWARPELPKPAEGTPEPAKTGDDEQAAWLRVADELYRDGFMPWKLWKHPKWGECQSGGFLPFFRESPTIAQARDLGTRSAPFLVALAAKSPRIEASEARLTPLADGLARVELRVTNTGTMPSTTEMGRITGVIPPIVVRLVDRATGKPLAPTAVLSGRPVSKIDRLEAAASQEYTWTVRMPDGGLDVAVSGPTFDTITRTAASTVASATKEVR